MGIQAAPEIKFQLIESAMKKEGWLLDVSSMCKIAGVSRSGYYRWLKSAPQREAGEARDRADFELILNAYKYKGYAKGARQIYMRLLHEGIRMNLKKIKRLMRKYQLRCTIRSINPYKALDREMRTNKVAQNLVNRQFRDFMPREVGLTDITYIPFKGTFCYLSTIKDVCTKEILAYAVSWSLKVDFVIKTMERLEEKHGNEGIERMIIHSDQGCHYTSNRFIEKLKEDDFVRSMSRKGNCWDNAPQESFFGHMKDEISEKLIKCKTEVEVEALIDDWIEYYNTERYQWDLAKLSPMEYYEYVKTGIYPLAKV